MDIVTGHVGSAHVTSWQDRDLNQGIFGPDTYILNVRSKLAATIISNNEIRIADGTLVMQGCQGVIQKGTYDTISIDNGTQGLKRNDLICAQYTKTGGVESMSLVVIKGTAASTPVDPSYTTGDIQNGDTPVQVPIYRVSLNGLTLESVQSMVETIAPHGSNYYHANGTKSFSGNSSITVYYGAEGIPNYLDEGYYFVWGILAPGKKSGLWINGGLYGYPERDPSDIYGYGLGGDSENGASLSFASVINVPERQELNIEFSTTGYAGSGSINYDIGYFRLR